MFCFIRSHKKIKYYLIILAVLWSGTFINTAFHTDAFLRQSAMASSKEGKVLLKKTCEGRLTLQQKKEIMQDYLSQYQAVKVKSIETEALFTVYAYSKEIKEYVIVSKQEINLNLLFYYDEIKDQTIFIAASPIYNGDF